MRHATLACLLGLALALTSCEDSVDPIVESERAFSLYGVLQPRSDTQWVRIYPIETRLTPARPAPLAATFTATELEGGAPHAWRDSVMQESDGRYAHVFWRPFRVAYDRTYRLQVTGEHGRATRVEVDVPPNAELVVQEPQIGMLEVTLPVLVNNDVPRLIHLEVEYHFQFNFESEAGANASPVARATVSYDGEQQQTENGWIVPINLTEDFVRLRRGLEDRNLWNPEFGLVMRDMTLRLAVVNAAWDPPGDAFDPEVLVEPGLMSNVENGFGFVGAGYRLEKEWTPSIETLTEAGWTDPTEL